MKKQDELLVQFAVPLATSDSDFNDRLDASKSNKNDFDGDICVVNKSQILDWKVYDEYEAHGIWLNACGVKDEFDLPPFARDALLPMANIAWAKYNRCGTHVSVCVCVCLERGGRGHSQRSEVCRGGRHPHRQCCPILLDVCAIHKHLPRIRSSDWALGRVRSHTMQSFDVMTCRNGQRSQSA